MDEFGWDYSRLTTVYEKASYLYTALIYTEELGLLENIKKVLDKNCIKYEFENPEDVSFYFVDHGENLCDFLNEVCNDECKLMRYLFSSESFITTKNDEKPTPLGVGWVVQMGNDGVYV